MRHVPRSDTEDMGYVQKRDRGGKLKIYDLYRTGTDWTLKILYMYKERTLTIWDLYRKRTEERQ